MEQQTGSKPGKEYIKAVYCHPAYLTSMQSTSWEMLGWMKYSWDQDCREKYQSPQICRWHHPMAESKELKSLLMKVKEESEKFGLKSTFGKITKITASGPINSWQIKGKAVETVKDFVFGGSKITVDCDCSHEIKRHLLLGRKVMTNQDSMLKSRDTTNKGLSSQGYGFSSSNLWMWELDHKASWVLKNWCFWTVVLEKTWEYLGLQGDPTSPS